jgi:hypothetical protein
MLAIFNYDKIFQGMDWWVNGWMDGWKDQWKMKNGY